MGFAKHFTASKYKFSRKHRLDIQNPLKLCHCVLFRRGLFNNNDNDLFKCMSVLLRRNFSIVR